MKLKLLKNWPREQTCFECSCGFIFDYAISCLRCELEHKGIENARTVEYSDKQIKEISKKYEDLKTLEYVSRNQKRPLIKTLGEGL